MRNDPFSRSSQQGPRRGGLFGNVRWLVLLAFAGYAAFYWFSNRSVDPYTGESVLIDSTLDVDQEKALGLQAYQEILAQERPLDPNAPVSRDVREIAQRLIAKVDVVETALAEEHGLQPGHFSRGFDWEVNVIQSDQANAFCLPGGKMAVYTGLVPVAQTRDAMAVVMGHEIAHALLRHGAQRMAQQKLTQIGQMAGAASGMDPQQQQMVMAAMGYGYLLPYARGHETQADEVGLMLAAAACFDPREAVPLWERMGQASGGQSQPEFSSTHPNPGTRIQNLQALMPKAMEYRERFCEQARQ
ncbi:peptidase [Stenotrophomonas chelatiphaga]|jgi:metalloendopeptidase OMA1, mitochondrial|uniref:Peptidase n=1 Tax=Stenotrophomonas chelatiphaga TaxID=517011 RepID=A0A0R0CZK5_9GAMM|nr:M48 family metallopeptidase [Stenotrophomonas chelatiphaga]KRG74587.1 peptidase [Stenotrophomonas chelatiphaga]MCS4231322.1 putative Zn-dependent protease [Stenotrophomonas chelatiphaga]ROQ42491.1 peptidase M48-like protein [Stenotrophomonas maltophilia]